MKKKNAKLLSISFILFSNFSVLAADNPPSPQQSKVIAYVRSGQSNQIGAATPSSGFPQSNSSSNSNWPPSSSSGSGGTGPSSKSQKQPAQGNQPQTPTQPTITPPVHRPPYVPPKPKAGPGPVYMEPGVVFIRNDQYHGSDYLGYLPKSYPIMVEIVKSEKETMPLSEEQLIDVVKKQFQEKYFTLQNVYNYQPEPPFLRIIVLLQPIDDRGYAAAIRLSLFETVKIDRVVLQEGNFQAITWERESLVVAPKESAGEYISTALKSLADQFVERYNFFNENLPEQKRGFDEVKDPK